MDFLPIIDRELRRLARRPMTYRIRSGTALAAALIGLGVLTVSVGGGANPTAMGRQLFLALGGLALGFSLLAGPILTADCLSEEKRLGTLGLLFLTNLKGHDVVAGKLVALTLPALHCLLALLPIMGMCFFMGGVTGGEFFRTALVLGNTLLFSLAVAMLVSAFCRSGRKALGASMLLILAAAAGLPGIALLVAHGKLPPNSTLLLLSPAYSALAAPDAQYALAIGAFWKSLLANQILSWGCLLAAGLCLPHTWQDKPAQRKTPRWLEWWRNLAVRRRREKARKEKLLELNPILWLAARSGRGSLGIWLFLATSLGFWMGGYYGLHQQWLGPATVFLVVYGLHAILKVWVTAEASRRFADDRNSGALELLLCTPLPEQNIWQGWLAHLRRRFLAPVAVLLVIDFMLMDGGVDNNGWYGGGGAWGTAFIAGMGLFVCDTYTLSWVGLWQGLTARNSTRACLNCILCILVLPAAGCLGILGMFGLFSTTGSVATLGMVVAIWFAVGYLVDFVMCGFAMMKLSRDFRSASIHGISGQRRSWRWWLDAETAREFTLEPVTVAVARDTDASAA